MIKATMSPAAAGVLIVLAAMPNDSDAQTEARRGPTASCESLRGLQLSDVRVTGARVLHPDQSRVVRVAHCELTGVIGREIRFAVLLPDEWNGRFAMGGAGGFAGTTENQYAAVVNDGYAASSTDTGHQGSALEARWALGHPDRLENFGFAAVHRTAEVTKEIIKAYYGAAPARSYFLGCSNGGRQALMEAQRYPEDFDGIVSGAPALSFTSTAIAFVRNAKLAFPSGGSPGKGAVRPEALKLLEAKVLEACDTLDGLKDGVMADPRDCHFALRRIRACPAGKAGADCLTSGERGAIEGIFAAVADANGMIYPGLVFGSEGAAEGWPLWIAGFGSRGSPIGNIPALQWAFGTEFFKYFVAGDSAWDYRRYSLANARRDTRAAAKILDATNPNLTPFKAHGGKLLLWHGWSDPALNARVTIAYYEQLVKGDSAAMAYARLFLLPGVVHCAGGPGPDNVSWVKAIVDWVERNQAPESLVATRRDSAGSVLRARPLCAYPKQAVYVGSGKPDDAASFVCRTSRGSGS
jgi:feruloyl esterase